MLRSFQGFLKPFNLTSIAIRQKKVIDRSLFPELNESDLEEHFIRSSGPGGQKVNKTSSCVYLLHKPTGIQVKVQDTRDQFQNKKIARERLRIALDNAINGENSVENQIKQIEKEKSKRRTQKQRKLAEMKSRWKELVSK